MTTREWPEITQLVESCCKSVGPDVDSASTPDGRPVYDYNLGVLNGTEEKLMEGVRSLVSRYFTVALSDREIQWRRRPHLHEWTDEKGRHLAVYMRFATSPVLDKNHFREINHLHPDGVSE